MDDRTFLIWVYERLLLLETEQNRNELADYYHKLRAIIYATPAGQYSVDTCTNSLADLKSKLITDFTKSLNP